MRALSFIRINSQEDRRPKRNPKELNKIGARLCEQFQPPTCCNILFGVVCDWTMSRRNTTWWLCGTDRVPLLKVVHNFSGFHDLRCFFHVIFPTFKKSQGFELPMDLQARTCRCSAGARCCESNMVRRRKLGKRFLAAWWNECGQSNLTFSLEIPWVALEVSLSYFCSLPRAAKVEWSRVRLSKSSGFRET
jgi:hypothetical protein